MLHSCYACKGQFKIKQGICFGYGRNNGGVGLAGHWLC